MTADQLVVLLRDKRRLRARHGLCGWVLHEESIMKAAAAEIERLQAELAVAKKDVYRPSGEMP